MIEHIPELIEILIENLPTIIVAIVEALIEAIPQILEAAVQMFMAIVEAIPETGRTHQLRVHFAHLGHAILGDDIYGEASDLISRHALHAYSLTLPLPYGDKELTFYSMPPDDMQECFKAMANMNLTDQMQLLRNENEKNTN